MSQQGPQPPEPPGPGQPTGPGQSSGPPTGPPQAPWQPPGQQPPWPGAQQGQVMYAQPSGTNGFAIASLICAFLCAPLGLVFGFIAKSQIKERHEGGDGLATAGIVISIVAIVLVVIYFILAITLLGTFFHSLNNIPFNNFQNNFQNNFGFPTPSA